MSTSSSLEQAYAAVEQAYAAGEFKTALDGAEALLPELSADRDDQLQQRLQLLIGHIHLYGLRQPSQAAAAYRAVLEHCQEPSYRASAEAGLQDAAATGQPAKTTATARAPEPAKPAQTKAPEPYDRGLLELELPGRPSELDGP